jgi:hypothetical protein
VPSATCGGWTRLSSDASGTRSSASPPKGAATDGH